MGAGELLKRARLAAGKTQIDIAWSAGTSRTTLSAYEHGRKSPTLDTAERILEAAGFEFGLERKVEFRDHQTARGRPFSVPDRLFRLPLERALATVALPRHLAGSGAPHDLADLADLADRATRRLVYMRVLGEGRPADIRAYIDGALLLDLWPELILPAEVRRAWIPLIAGVLGQGAV